MVDHFERHSSFRRARGFGDTQVDEQAVSILHEGMGREAELGLHSFPFAYQPRLWIGGRLVLRIVSMLTKLAKRHNTL